jgi:hypothetical protein
VHRPASSARSNAAFVAASCCSAGSPRPPTPSGMLLWLSVFVFFVFWISDLKKETVFAQNNALLSLSLQPALLVAWREVLRRSGKRRFSFQGSSEGSAQREVMVGCFEHCHFTFLTLLPFKSRTVLMHLSGEARFRLTRKLERRLVSTLGCLSHVWAQVCFQKKSWSQLRRRLRFHAFRNAHLNRVNCEPLPHKRWDAPSQRRRARALARTRTHDP